MFRLLMKRKLLIKMIFSYAAVGLVLIGVFAYIIVDRVSHNLTRQVNDSVNQMIGQSYNATEILLNNTYNYAASVFADDPKVFEAMYGDRYSGVELYKIDNMLSDMKAANSLIDSIDIFNFNHNQVFSSDSSVQSISGFYDKGLVSLLRSKGSAAKGIFIPRIQKHNDLNQIIHKKLITIVYRISTGDTSPDAAMVVNLNQQTLQELVSRGYRTKSVQSFIINRDGIVISHNDSELFNHNVSHVPYIHRILQSSKYAGEMNENINGRSEFVSYVKSSTLGWTFIGIANNSRLLDSVYRIKRYILWMACIFVLLAAVTALFSIRHFYVPLNQLVNSVRSSKVGLRDYSAVNEYDLLSMTFRFLEGKVHDLQKDVSGYLPAKKKELLRSIIKGIYSNKNIVDPELSGLADANRFQVCMIRMDHYTQCLKKWQLTDISLFKFAIGNIAEEILPVSTETLDDNDDAIVLLLYGKNATSSIPILKYMKDIQQNVRQYLKLSITISIGPIVYAFADISISWNQAFQASRYRLIHGPGTIISAQDSDWNNRMQHDYPLQLEKPITDSVKMGDKRKLSEAVNHFFGEIANYRYDEIMLFVNQLIIITTRTSGGMIGDEDLMKVGMNTLPDSIQHLETLDDIRDEFLMVCERIIARRDENASRKNDKMVAVIKEEIHGHYHNPDMTADDLAELVGLSTNYARKLFKDDTGKTMSQYLLEYRFEHAKELLLSTDLPASKIGEQVGMMNTNYFYASFKKYTGKSPNHYRKEYKLQHPAEMESEAGGK